jgi:hypothetical protein
MSMALWMEELWIEWTVVVSTFKTVLFGDAKNELQ